MDTPTLVTREPNVAVPTAPEADRLGRLDSARRAEREGLLRLRQRFRESHEHYERAVRSLAEFDQLLGEIKSVLSRYGYLGGGRP
jgi:hypothetical protein